MISVAFRTMLVCQEKLAMLSDILSLVINLTDAMLLDYHVHMARFHYSTPYWTQVEVYSTRLWSIDTRENILPALNIPQPTNQPTTAQLHGSNQDKMVILSYKFITFSHYVNFYTVFIHLPHSPISVRFSSTPPAVGFNLQQTQTRNPAMLLWLLHARLLCSSSSTLCQIQTRKNKHSRSVAPLLPVMHWSLGDTKTTQTSLWSHTEWPQPDVPLVVILRCLVTIISHYFPLF